MAKAKQDNEVTNEGTPEVKGETVKEEGKQPLASPQGVNKPKEKITLPNGTVIEHF